MTMSYHDIKISLIKNPLKNESDTVDSLDELGFKNIEYINRFEEFNIRKFYTKEENEAVSQDTLRLFDKDLRLSLKDIQNHYCHIIAQLDLFCSDEDGCTIVFEDGYTPDKELFSKVVEYLVENYRKYDIVDLTPADTNKDSLNGYTSHWGRKFIEEVEIGKSLVRDRLSGCYFINKLGAIRQLSNSVIDPSEGKIAEDFFCKSYHRVMPRCAINLNDQPLYEKHYITYEELNPIIKFYILANIYLKR